MSSKATIIFLQGDKTDTTIILISHVKVRLPSQEHTACKLSPPLRAVRWKITFDNTCMKMSAVITSTYHRFLSVFVSKCFSGFCSVLSRISTLGHLALNQLQLLQRISQVHQFVKSIKLGEFSTLIFFQEHPVL